MTDYSTIKNVDDFETLIEYLEEELDWQFNEIEDVEDALYEYDAKEFGLDSKHSAKIESTKQIIPFIHVGFNTPSACCGVVYFSK